MIAIAHRGISCIAETQHQQTYLETPIAKGILRGEFGDGDTIYVDVENERLAFKRLLSELMATT